MFEAKRSKHFDLLLMQGKWDLKTILLYAIFFLIVQKDLLRPSLFVQEISFKETRDLIINL